MKLINSKFNIDEWLRINPNAESWYKNTFPHNSHMFPVITEICKERFIVYDIAKFLRQGNVDLHVQKFSDLSIINNPSEVPVVIFKLDRFGICADPQLCWSHFNEPLFIKEKK